jgi:3'-phosphoadenosine 5'-phosphosulfate (PAPS) 3'-phosphatase
MEEQLAQEMIALKLHNNYPQHPVIKEENKPQEN